MSHKSLKNSFTEFPACELKFYSCYPGKVGFFGSLCFTQPCISETSMIVHVPVDNEVKIFYKYCTIYYLPERYSGVLLEATRVCTSCCMLFWVVGSCMKFQIGQTFELTFFCSVIAEAQHSAMRLDLFAQLL